MKKFTTIFVFLFLSVYYGSTLFATEPVINNWQGAKEIGLGIGIGEGHLFNKGDKLKPTTLDSHLSIDFKVLDSLANAFSFYTNNQEPIVYHSESQTLVMIKRGYGTPGGTVDATNPDNTLNNLFIRTSTDWGATWSNPALVYNSLTAGFGNARYPSVHPFIFEGALTYVYVGPLTTGTGWVGYVGGLFIDGNPVISKLENFTQNEIIYEWAMGESAPVGTSIIGGEIDGNPVSLIFGSPTPRLDLRNGTNQSPLGFASTDNFSVWDSYIPNSFRSELFQEPDKDANPTTWQNARYSSIINLRKASNGDLYAGITGNFREFTDGRLSPAFAISSDNGETWSDLVVCSTNLLFDYAVNLGALRDSVSFGSRYKFAVNNDGSVSFITLIGEFNQDKPDEQTFRHIVEITYKDNTWNIRKIADHSGLVRVYTHDAGQQSTSQLGFEIQLSRTIDGNTLLAKWVDFVEYQDEFGTTANLLDIFVSTRNINETTWKRPVNLTNNPDDDKITWIPDYLPNDLKNIPVIKLTPINQIQIPDLDLIKNQYVEIGQFNADESVLSIEEGMNANLDANIIGIHPNPAGEIFELNLYFNKMQYAEIDIYNVLGEKVINIAKALMQEGAQSYNVNTKNLPIGNYYITLSSNGKRVTKTLSVIR